MKHPLFSGWWGKFDLHRAINADPYGIRAALDERKANREAYRAQERSDAARKGWATRRGGAA